VEPTEDILVILDIINSLLLQDAENIRAAKNSSFVARLIRLLSSNPALKQKKQQQLWLKIQLRAFLVMHTLIDIDGTNCVFCIHRRNNAFSISIIASRDLSRVLDPSGHRGSTLGVDKERR